MNITEAIQCWHYTGFRLAAWNGIGQEGNPVTHLSTFNCGSLPHQQLIYLADI